MKVKKQPSKNEQESYADLINNACHRAGNNQSELNQQRRGEVVSEGAQVEPARWDEREGCCSHLDPSP